MMNTEQLAAWLRIESVPLIGAEEDLLFHRKLALQNHWSPEFTDRCILEYRKFAFLAVTCKHPVSPSDAVDQVWHLHLTYTREYWKMFCPEVLKQPLHHSPSKGGAKETQKFQDWYESTLASYRSFFGPEPSEIWPAAFDKSFQERRLYRRVDTGRYWIVPKPSWLVEPSRWVAVLLVMFGVGCSSLRTTSAKWIMDGETFLSAYIASLAVVILVCIAMRRAIRGPLPDGRIVRNLSFYEMAFLAGGVRRVLQAIVVRLHEAGAVKLNDKGNVIRSGKLETVLDPIEVDLRQSVEVTEKNWDQLRKTVQGRLDAIRNRLESMGLLVARSDVSRVRKASAWIMGLALFLGALRIWQGLREGYPTGFLVVLIILGFGVMLWFLQGPFRTRTGDAELEKLQEIHGKPNWKRGEDSGLMAGAQLALAVGLLGPTVLKDTPLEKIQSKLGPEYGTGCGGGCGGSSCGGGGCGGGCGGCG